jgi:predicted TIM-barrel fold metal-dependent hydrolase
MLGILMSAAAAAAQPTINGPAPVIDMHMHALAADEQGPPPLAMCTPFEEFPEWDQRKSYTEIFFGHLKRPTCKDPVWSPTTDEALMRETIAAMDRLNVYGVLSGPYEHSSKWRKAAPNRFFPALSFDDPKDVSVKRLEQLHRAGELAVMGEVTTQYQGIEPTDPRLEPYWALAERLDIPVQLHVGTGPFGVIYMGAGGYRARLHSALSVEEVLVKHPKLRIYLAHAGYPMIDDLLALLYAHPQVYVDTGVIIFTQPRAAFYRYLERIFEAGFGKRVMFGSDQMVWPGVIERSIKVIEDAPILTAEQKRDVLYNNAARFLRLGVPARGQATRLSPERGR